MEYIGRCDMCGQNLYDYDDTVVVHTGFVGMTVCRNCCTVHRGKRGFDIVDLLDAIDKANEQKTELK